MVDTRKFSDFTDGGDLQNDNITVGLESGDNTRFNNPWTFLPEGATGDRPPIAPSMYYRLRFNTNEVAYEYYDPISASWIEIEDGASILPQLASHGAGQGASLIGLENQSNVTNKTVQDFANASFIAQVSNGALQNAQYTSLLPTGFVSVTTTTGVLNSRTIGGTVNQINVTNSDGAGNSVHSLSSTLDFPGTFTVQGSTAISAIINDNTMASALSTNIPTASSVKAYVDSVGGGLVDSVNGTVNRIDVDNTSPANPIVDISTSYVGQASITTLGTIATGTWQGTIISPIYGGTGFNNGANTLILAGTLATSGAFASTFTMTGATNVTFPTSGTLATVGNTVSSITGTANQIAASSPTGPVTLSIASNPVLPGTAGVTLPIGNTAQQGGIAGTIRFNSQTSVFEGTLDGIAWTPFSTAAGTVVSVSGTANRITSTGGATPIIDISASYVGQSSITTLGTITTGVWNGTTIAVANGGTGLTSTTANQLLYSSSNNVIAGLATANNGLLITSPAGVPSISSVIPSAAITASGLITQVAVQVFTASGTYTPTSGMKYCDVYVTASGGGGGGAAAGASGVAAAGGGGAGGTSIKWGVTAAAVGASQTVTVGAGGAGGVAGGNNGSPGAVSSFGAIITTLAGLGGLAGSNQTVACYPILGGAGGGQGSGGSINIGGGAGGFSVLNGVNVLLCSGNGGASYWGGGGLSVNTSAAGNAGVAYGSGGGGAGATVTTNRAGGAGAPGIVVVLEYI